MECPCSKSKSYQDCCAQFHNYSKYPVTAEQLMRSRYSAYVLKDAEYLISTQYESNKNKRLRNELNELFANIVWIKLDILDKNQGQNSDEIGYVKFKAYYQLHGKMLNMQENSKFIKHDKRWYYHSAI